MFKEKSHKQGIIKSENYLSSSYRPPKPQARNKEVKKIVEALKPLASRKEPDNLFIHGPAGVGKTTCIKHVFDNLEQETYARTVYINCWQYNSRQSLITELLIQLGYPAVRRGKAVDELFTKLQTWLDRNRSIAVALDEFDQMNEQEKVIYDLIQASKNAEHEINLTLISNNKSQSLKFDKRSHSRLSLNHITFNPYTANQLHEILEKRVKEAFRPNSVSDDLIWSISEHIAERSGDCRDALDLLLRAARKADYQNEKRVKEEHLKEVI